MMDQNSIYIKKEVIHQLPKQFYQPSYTILKLDRPILSQYKKQLFEREENKNITNHKIIDDKEYKSKQIYMYNVE